MLNPIVDKARPSLEAMLNESIDGPERVVVEALLTGSIEQVRALALDGGLVSNGLRQVAWPFLMSDTLLNGEAKPVSRDEKAEIETFKQIELDVPRSVDPPHREQLETFLKAFFTKHKDLCFYQGFADLAWAVLRIMTDGVTCKETGEAAAHFVLTRLSRFTYLRDAHRATFEGIFAYLPAVDAIIERQDKQLGQLWREASANQYWAISPLLCMFSHDIKDTARIGRILDAIIAQERVLEFPIYLVAALPMLPRVRTRILEVEMEACQVHETMLEAIRDPMNVEDLINAALRLQERVPSKFVVKTAMAAGLPSDSCLAQYFQSEASGIAMSKKRSWRTFSFFSQTLEVGIFH